MTNTIPTPQLPNLTAVECLLAESRQLRFESKQRQTETHLIIEEYRRIKVRLRRTLLSFG